MLAYDDMLVLLAGSKAASEKAHIEGKQDFTGRIAFDVNGDPTAKTNLILSVDASNTLHLIAHDGCFLVNASCNNRIVLTEK
jgi:hypothetical protein